MRGALAVLLAPALLAGYSISGTVFERSGDELEPLRKALVVARTPDGRDVLGATRSGDDGRYVLAGLGGLVRVTAGRGGYYTHSAGGTADLYLAVNCDSAHCGEFDFELARAAVITGRVVDDLGEPAVGAQVRASRPDETQDGRPRFHQGRTDEQGVYRIFGLRPGSYEVRANAPFRGLSETLWVSRPVEVELEAGEEKDLALSVRPAPQAGFRVSGIVSGVNLEAPGARSVILNAVKLDPTYRTSHLSRTTVARPDGGFEFSNVPPGTYSLLFRGGWRGVGATRQARPQLLDVIDVRGDLEGLALSPMGPTGVRGRMVIEEAAAGTKPAVLLRPIDRPGGAVLAGGFPDYEFNNSSLMPGRYEATARTPGLYVARIESEGLELSGNIVVRPGRVQELTFVLSGAFATVSGQVKPADAAPFRVGLRGERGTVSVQSDQAGRFEIPRVKPGEYRIGAWAGAGERDLESEALWALAGERAPRFTADEHSEIEISLTAIE